VRRVDGGLILPLSPVPPQPDADPMDTETLPTPLAYETDDDDLLDDDFDDEDEYDDDFDDEDEYDDDFDDEDEYEDDDDDF
jgi:hypothetical protein